VTPNISNGGGHLSNGGGGSSRRHLSNGGGRLIVEKDLAFCGIALVVIFSMAVVSCRLDTPVESYCNSYPRQISCEKSYFSTKKLSFYIGHITTIFFMK
jgi:hypothetical protein